MLHYPQIPPEAFSMGPLVVRWYGLMYLFGFLTAWVLGRRRSGPGKAFSGAHFEEMLTWCIVGVILGGRLGYVLFYDFSYYLDNPARVLEIWRGGMSFHGGLLGVLAALWITAWRRGLSFLQLTDFAAPLVPPGLFFGRLGNFINGELWGRPTDVPWGMPFPGAGDMPRHPSQLYEAALEGVVLFAVVWIFSRKSRPIGAVSGMFALGYGLMRCFVEFFREPDAQLGFLAFGFVTMGMVLCLPLILIGIFLLWRAYAKNPQEPPSMPRAATKAEKAGGKKKGRNRA